MVKQEAASASASAFAAWAPVGADRVCTSQAGLDLKQRVSASTQAS